MPKTLTCRDVGVDCDFQATGETEDDVLRQASEHAKTAHGFDGIPPELAEKVQAAIKDA
jgi:predicted small metal-binding protein